MPPAAAELPFGGTSEERGGQAKRQRVMDEEATANGNHGSSWDCAELFSIEGRKRRMPALRSLITAFSGVPGVIGMHGGFPPADAFPFESISFKLRDGSSFEISEPSKVAAAQQYSVAMKGFAPLMTWVKEHVNHLHHPRYPHDMMVTNGSNATIESVLRLFLDPGATFLTEEHTYPHMYEAMVLPGNLNVLGVPMDSEGIIPEALAAILSGEFAPGGSKPRLLYTVPTGQNPTGAVTSLERKQAVYKLCQQYGILILEDDPYFYLQFKRGPGGTPGGLQNLGTSYLSLDTDGRVIRLDSFAKVLVPGLRLGWVTAAPAVIEKLVYYLHGISLGAPAMSQVIVSELLEHWGEAGFDAHVRKVQSEYSRRAKLICKAAEKSLKGLAEWEEPVAGMFFWVKVTVDGLTDLQDMLELLKDKKVVVVPGRLAACDGPDSEKHCPCARISYSSATDAEIVEGMHRFGEVLHSFKPASAPPVQSGIPVHGDLLRCVSGQKPEVISSIGPGGFGGLVGGKNGELKGTDMIGTC
eukprot:jgi/Botrbrau1/10669/Bobra.53_2s0024.1